MQLPKWLDLGFQVPPTTSFFVGASLQFLLLLLLPTHLAFLPTATLLAARAIEKALGMTRPGPRTPFPNNVVQGRYTAQMPRSDGSFSSKSAEAEVVVFMLGVNSNHAKGRTAPGMQEVMTHFQTMWKEAEADPKKWGYLGRSSPLTSVRPETSNNFFTLSYWKDVESLRKFSEGSAHRAGRDWWNRNSKQHPHMGIMHEVYAVPKGHWANIYINFPPFGMGQTRYPNAEGQDGSVNPLIEARGPQWASTLSQMTELRR